MAACENNKACFTTSHLTTGWRRDRWNVGTSQFLFHSLESEQSKGLYSFQGVWTDVSQVARRSFSLLWRHQPAANKPGFCSSTVESAQRMWLCRSSDAVRLTILIKSVPLGMLHLFSAAVFLFFFLFRSAWPADCWPLDCILITFGWLLLHAHSNAFKAAAFLFIFWFFSVEDRIWLLRFTRSQLIPELAHRAQSHSPFAFSFYKLCQLCLAAVIV